ncbi:unnamed protein product [Darwinula stevensoni]|uniref:Calcium-activated chloride channel N-terminal domain-containing protein n=1 Tax=Darwinula stevensoni TaxID=69355 RepID=A0A7R9A156_9CRUS|nr:unnamed protein product [Darwinula stevensoni]CAG0887034.1 unnamed protein product [Darwinula stevensoni]
MKSKMTVTVGPVTVDLVAALSLVCLLPLASGWDRLTVANGGFDGVVVAIHPDLDPGLCDLKVEIERAIRDGSTALQNATDGILHFKTVYVVVPRSWTDCATDMELPSSFASADVRIVGEAHPLYGNDPWTFQYGPCGTPGRFIQFTAEYFQPSSDGSYGPRGKTFAREWLKYRYGVFDELGYPNDPLYPAFYGSPDGPSYPLGKPTGCSDVPIPGNTTTSTDGTKSVFVPDLLSSSASESLLYMDFLPKVKGLCTHNDGIAPTKQNVLCGYRSARDVVMSHNDTNFPSNQPIQPDIKWARESPRHLIFVLQRYGIVKDTYFALRAALYNILDLMKRYQVELRTSVVLLAPSGAPDDNNPQLQDVSDINLNDERYIPSQSHSLGEVCFQCAEEKAMNVKGLCTHNDGIAPTKQNVLCGYRSARDVVMSHNDTNFPSNQPIQPDIKWARESPRHLIFVLQRYGIVKDTYFALRAALYNILDLMKRYQVELRTSVVLLAPSDAPDDNNPQLQDVSDINLNDERYIPSQGYSFGEVCFQCAEEKAMNILPPELLDYSELLILTNKANPDPGDSLENAHLRYHFIHVGEKVEGGEFEQLALDSGGTYQDVSLGEGPSQNVVHFVDALRIVFPSLLSWKVSEQTFLLNGDNAPPQRFDFTVPKDLNSPKILARIYLNSHEGQILTFKAPDTDNFKNYTAEDFKNGNVITTTLDNKAGNWTLAISNYESGEQIFVLEILLPLDATVSAQRLGKDDLEFHLWTSWDRLPSTGLQEAEKLYPDDPLIIYAYLKYGESPVVSSCKDPNVKAIELTVESRDMSQEGGFQMKESLFMLDDGRGDPDVRHGDGIFSAYFVNFTKVTQRWIAYKFKAKIGGSQQFVDVILDSRKDYDTGLMKPDPNSPVPYCCGSTIGDAKCESVRAFTAEVTGKVLSVKFNRIDGDMFPPSRVTDLTVTRDGATLVFTWSAAGNDYNYRPVDDYVLNGTDATGNWIREETVKLDLGSTMYGDPLRFNYTLASLGIEESGSYSFQIRATDGTNQGRLSNRANLHHQVVDGRIDLTKENLLALILFAALVPLALAGLGVFLFFYFRKRREGHKAAKPDSTSFRAGTKERPNIEGRRTGDDLNFISASEYQRRRRSERNPEHEERNDSPSLSSKEKGYTESYEANPTVYAYSNRGFDGGHRGSDSETASSSDGGFKNRSKRSPAPSSDLYTIPVPYRPPPVPIRTAPAPRPRAIQTNPNVRPFDLKRASSLSTLV